MRSCGPDLGADLPFLALAPMEGVTDAPFRAVVTGLAANQGAIDLCVTEFVRVTSERVPPAVLLRTCPELQRSGRTPAGVPVFVQLLGGRPEPMAATAALAAMLGAPGIDLNFGCPAPTVNRHDGGAALLRQPERIEAIVRAVRAAVPAGTPVTAKIRLGWADAAHVETLARAAETGGATWLTVHARTRVQGYAPPVDWSAIARARRAVAIPVVGNGDLRTPADVAQCRQESGCQAFMLGRGVLARPEIFGRLRGRPTGTPGVESILAPLRHYVALLLEAGVTAAQTLGRGKQWLRLAANLRPELAALFERAKVLRELAALEELLG